MCELTVFCWLWCNVNVLMVSGLHVACTIFSTVATWTVRGWTCTCTSKRNKFKVIEGIVSCCLIIICPYKQGLVMRLPTCTGRKEKVKHQKDNGAISRIRHQRRDAFPLFFSPSNGPRPANLLSSSRCPCQGNPKPSISRNWLHSPIVILRQKSPHLSDANSLSGQHHILQAIHVATVNWRNEMTGNET